MLTAKRSKLSYSDFEFRRVQRTWATLYVSFNQQISGRQCLHKTESILYYYNDKPCEARKYNTLQRAYVQSVKAGPKTNQQDKS